MKPIHYLLGGGVALVLFGAGAAAAATPEQARLDFVAALNAAFMRLLPTMRLEGRILAIAQAAFESGWGQSKVAKQGLNYFNVTRVASDTRPVIVSGDQACKPDGTCTPITQRFAKYGSVDEGLAAYLSLIAAPRYTDAFAQLQAGATSAFAASLYKGGYFTLPLPQYLSSLQSVYNSVQRRMPLSVA